MRINIDLVSLATLPLEEPQNIPQTLMESLHSCNRGTPTTFNETQLISISSTDEDDVDEEVNTGSKVGLFQPLSGEDETYLPEPEPKPYNGCTMRDEIEIVPDSHYINSECDSEDEQLSNAALFHGDPDAMADLVSDEGSPSRLAFTKRGRPFKLYGDYVWKATKSSNKSEFVEAMNQLKDANMDAYNWVMKIDAKHWSRHAFDEHVKSDHVTNNIT
ncbi:hypothetical protein LWI28_020914 [Acer negundo]|uniref:Uncharacterized protein n=1 Tax=Acer negundo TaxID=4023 RepID=A0AAD5NQL5_ACENE|nr:hypothetical protein LWI28_020914 [Acer negundo]